MEKGDLISRSALMEAVRNTITEQSSTIDWLNLINKQPIAYDVEKVIEQLDAEETEWCDKYCAEKAKGNIDLYADGFGEGLTRALQIVRAGGKE